MAIAQRVLVAVQNDLRRKSESFSAASFYDADFSAPIVAASRILDAASQAGNLEMTQSDKLALLSAAAFSMYGNFPSASAVLQRVIKRPTILDSRTKLAAACFSPRYLSMARLAAIQSNDQLASSAIEKIQSFLGTGNPLQITEADALLKTALLESSDNFQNLLLGYARVALRQVEELSTARNLSKINVLKTSVVDSLLSMNLLTLLPSQYSVLCQSALFTSRQNALICLPTSTGKTLIGELAIAAELSEKPGLAIYLAPYVAIGTQAAKALMEHLPPEYRIHTLVGGLSSNIHLDPPNVREVVVATPERLDLLIRQLPSLLNFIRVVIVDEAHVVSDGVRGARLEALLTRLRLRQANGQKMRLICLSAVMAQAKDFCDWLGVPSEMYITRHWRPTARRVAIWRNSNNLAWLYAGDEFRPQGVSETAVFGTRSLVWPRRMFHTSDFGPIKSQSSALAANTAFLCRQMYEEHQEPILCICSSRASSRNVAYEIADDMERFEVPPKEVLAATEYIDKSAPHLAGLRYCLSRGVAFHNAALPLRLRLLIERAVEKRSIKVVCATTTLAEGVDLPFRVTVMAEWLQWRLDTKDQQKPYGALKFRNIAGRSGRAGVFTEGDTIIFENVLGPSKFTDQQNRIASIFSMLAKPQEARSALEEDVLPDELEARKDVIASSFLAAISENPANENLANSYAESLLARKLADGAGVTKVVSEIQAEVLGGGEAAFATAASPLQLTPLGIAASKSLFSPASCRKILATIGELADTYNFVDLSALLLWELGNLPEQPNSEWRKATTNSRSRFLVKSADMPQVLTQWGEGYDLPKIFMNLPSVLKSKAQESVSDWFNGTKRSETWADRFDKFSDFSGTVIEEYLPRLLNACAALAPFASGSASQQPWNEYVQKFNDAFQARTVESASVILS